VCDEVKFIEWLEDAGIKNQFARECAENFKRKFGSYNSKPNLIMTDFKPLVLKLVKLTNSDQSYGNRAFVNPTTLLDLGSPTQVQIEYRDRLHDDTVIPIQSDSMLPLGVVSMNGMMRHQRTLVCGQDIKVIPWQSESITLQSIRFEVEYCSKVAIVRDQSFNERFEVVVRRLFSDKVFVSSMTDVMTAMMFEGGVFYLSNMWCVPNEYGEFRIIGPNTEIEFVFDSSPWLFMGPVPIVTASSLVPKSVDLGDAKSAYQCQCEDCGGAGSHAGGLQSPFCGQWWKERMNVAKTKLEQDMADVLTSSAHMTTPDQETVDNTRAKRATHMLPYACASADYDSVDLCLNNGADVNMVVPASSLPLFHHCVMELRSYMLTHSDSEQFIDGIMSVFKRLLAAKPELNTDGAWKIMDAIKGLKDPIGPVLTALVIKHVVESDE